MRKKGYDVVVDNAGVNGDTLDARCISTAPSAPDTDIALVEFGTNDRAPRAPMKTVRSRLTEIVRTLRARKIEVLVIGLGSLKLDDVARAENVAYAQWILPPENTARATTRITTRRAMPSSSRACCRRSRA